MIFGLQRTSLKLLFLEYTSPALGSTSDIIVLLVPAGRAAPVGATFSRCCFTVPRDALSISDSDGLDNDPVGIVKAVLLGFF